MDAQVEVAGEQVTSEEVRRPRSRERTKGEDRGESSPAVPRSRADAAERFKGVGQATGAIRQEAHAGPEEVPDASGLLARAEVGVRCEGGIEPRRKEAAA